LILIFILYRVPSVYFDGRAYHLRKEVVSLRLSYVSRSSIEFPLRVNKVSRRGQGHVYHRVVNRWQCQKYRIQHAKETRRNTNDQHINEIGSTVNERVRTRFS